ncbi:MAG TPA: FAD-binding oxidoreductase [Nocardiopsis listeri]|uniref:FAD-binding oxidoreductase n=1 Tax=Nocardiopsis listeri TaxID=53440 RepID=UPI001E03366A|nr:FAD-binding oxidoreductase [Nocardiopsis listeri]HJE61351.1 FAD-binding oxidoreductase [Nocardiopsis listeri]
MTEPIVRGDQPPRRRDIDRRTLLRAGGVLGAAGALGVAGTPAYGTGRPDNWLRPGDEGYEEAVAGFNTTVTRRPEAVILARDARDVQRAVRYAGRHDLPVCVMATGHQASVSFDGGVLVSTAAMDRIRVDQRSSSVRVGPGARWGPIAEATAPHGLAGLVGSSVSVGAVGYTLGGGLSPTFGRLHGYAADHVSRLEIVTADGELRVATPEHEQDLFWAARGGKGNFGIVTSLDFGLFDVRTLYAGAILYPAEAATEVLPAWRDWAAEVPESVTTSAAFLRVPPDAPLPDPVRGRLVVSVRVSFVGEATEGAGLVAPLRAVAPALLDTVEEMPFTDWDLIHSDPEGPIPAYERTSLLGGLPDAAIETMIGLAGAGSDSPMSLVEVRRLGGALAREPEVPSAVGHRDAAFTFFTIGLAPPGQVERVRAYAAMLVEAMEPWSTGGAYVNFLSGDEAGPADVRRVYSPEVYERLVSVKSDVDSRNMFRLTHNIPPG